VGLAQTVSDATRNRLVLTKVITHTNPVVTISNNGGNSLLEVSPEDKNRREFLSRPYLAHVSPDGGVVDRMLLVTVTRLDGPYFGTPKGVTVLEAVGTGMPVSEGEVVMRVETQEEHHFSPGDVVLPLGITFSEAHPRVLGDGSTHSDDETLQPQGVLALLDGVDDHIENSVLRWAGWYLETLAAYHRRGMSGARGRRRPEPLNLEYQAPELGILRNPSQTPGAVGGPEGGEPHFSVARMPGHLLSND